MPIGFGEVEVGKILLANLKLKLKWESYFQNKKQDFTFELKRRSHFNLKFKTGILI